MKQEFNKATGELVLEPAFYKSVKWSRTARDVAYIEVESKTGAKLDFILMVNSRNGQLAVTTLEPVVPEFDELTAEELKGESSDPEDDE